MKNGLLLLCFSIGLIGVGCKSEYEKIRTSGETERLYESAFKYYEEGDYLKAQSLLELIIPQYRGKKELEKIYYTYADTYYQLERYTLAAYYFLNFANTFPNSSLREDARYMSAFSNYQLSPSYRLEQSATLSAITEFEEFANTYPSSERIPRINALIDELRAKLEKKALASADLYLDLRQYQSAVQAYENLLREFPETKNGERIRHSIVKAYYDFATNSIFSKQEERYQNAKKYAERFLSKYAESDLREEVQRYYDNSVNRLNNLSNGKGYQRESTGAGS